MQNKHDSSIRSHDCYLKRCVKSSSTKYSFYEMESRISSNCTRNISKPFTPEYEVNRKENTGKDCQTATDSKVYECSDIDLGDVPLHYAMFCEKENRDLKSKIYHVYFGGIS